MNRALRRGAPIALATVSALLLVGCASGSEPSATTDAAAVCLDVPSGDLSDGVQVTGDFGAAPTAEFTTPAAHAVGAAVHDEHHLSDIKDVTPIEWVAWTPMLVLILVLGVFPNLLFRVFDPAVNALIDHLGRYLG